MIGKINNTERTNMSYKKISLFSLIFFSNSIFYTQINAMQTATQSIEKNLFFLDKTISKLHIQSGQTWAAKGNCVELEKIIKSHELAHNNFKDRFNESKRLNCLPLLKEIDFDIQAYLVFNTIKTY